MAALDASSAMSAVTATVLVRWAAAAGAAPAEHRAETLVDNSDTKAAMSEGFWLYNGSLIVDGRFQAEIEKSFVAVITDPDALMNNPRPGHNDETIWTAATTRLPPVGTVVEFVIQLPPLAPTS